MQGAEFSEDAKSQDSHKVVDEKDTEQTHVAPKSDSSEHHLEGLPLAVVMSGLILSLFLPALDQLILATAMPVIVSKFNSLQEISWIPNAYFLAMGGFMIIFGQIVNLAPSKYVLLASVFTFELGSLLCGVAFNMNFLLFGRGVAGMGAAGLYVTIFAIIAQIAPLDKRAKLMGLGGATFGVTSIIGPLVGGALTDNASWRWCFFINLPIGGFAAAIVVFFLPNYKARPKPPNRQGWRGLLGIDYIGGLLALGTTMTFIYPLVEGGNAHPWNSAIIIALFITSGVLAGLFVAWSAYMGNDSVLPLRLFKNKSVIGSSMCGFFVSLNLMVSIIYLTTWYQAVKGHSPTRSGVDVLSLCLGTSVFAVIGGIIVGRTGRYWLTLVLMPLLGAIAAGLEFTINETTSTARLVGYQILWAVSIGPTLQLPTLAAQAEYHDNMVDTRFATAAVSFVSFVGRMVGLGVGSALFTNRLAKYLPIYAPTAPQEVVQSVTAIWTLSPDIRDGVIHAYVLSLRYAFILGVPSAGLTTIFALMIRNRKLNKPGERTSSSPKEETGKA
ncbi:hypothetical protein M422DRAFT_263011 [Sphaerobolus stellatus SS14]|uniref:Major facilitator superfamily (MFS) profile domain-containing protein n=1 Tax=Sphaerobolus stellatus (strain SS14) TaxID=990650 RepID=A0A0C9UZT4_SPHS4|nr:hypothetical protein M422DRAFT_263011 [Sphaerobolus stellatus SS14]